MNFCQTTFSGNVPHIMQVELYTDHTLQLALHDIAKLQEQTA